VKVTFITRWFTVLAVLMLVAVAPVRRATADALPQAAHLTSQSAPETKIGSAAHVQPLRPGFQFPYGQTFHYEGEWRFWTAGLATLRVEHVGAQDHVAATADSNGVVAMLYRVQDRFNSYFDSKTLCSTKLIKHAEEGSHRRDTTITYDYSRGKAVLEEKNLKDNTQKRTENEIPNCVTDVVSGILYIASLPLQQGATYTFPLNDGGNTATVQAHVDGKEQVKTPAGTFQTIRVIPEGDSGILKSKGRFWIWYTDDDRHLPIQMRAKLFWGTVTVYLSSITK
jgi:hypothetical protein